jgi:hypothetical protein
MVKREPAFLFYPGDFLAGTALFSYEQRGKYIVLLCLHHAHGFITSSELDLVCGDDKMIRSKFQKNSAGNWVNARMLIEKQEREKYCKMQSDRANRRWHPTNESETPKSENSDFLHENVIENENENENENEKHRSGIDPVMPTQSRGNATASKFDFIDQVINAFASEYIIEFNMEYFVTNRGKERTAAGKLVNMYKSKHPNADSQSTIDGLKTFFIQCFRVDDPWIRDNMSLSIIISQFNKIQKLLMNGKSTKSGKAKTSGDDIDRIVKIVGGDKN